MKVRQGYISKCGRFGYIPLNVEGKFTKVAVKDFAFLSQWNWLLTKSGYVSRSCDNLRMHRLLTNAACGQDVDHIDNDKQNNDTDNLRLCTHQQNMCNQRLYNKRSSRFKGVTWNKRRNKWYAQIKYKGKKMFLGSYDNEVEAATAYNRKAIELFGQFAKVNDLYLAS